ncbi:periplasmic binding protein-like I [Fimicolochytrium jonesii]|uniref:periplasmic binding protein-like I n=1 Tax=Fimicolochytrium jonesii TaxID=1396493 RepID=UPI0022FF07A3|nr:periplasmic binding protein-like I [Fimicolochytrium jonesii]KAI8816196.1 periplasmic binding protein-like I [Fimicolochytrium jonesii]
MRVPILLSAVLVMTAVAAADIIKLVTVLPFSTTDVLATNANLSMSLAIEEINAAALFPGATVTLDYRNDQNNKAREVATGLDLISGGYSGVVGSYLSDQSKMLAYTLTTPKIFQCSGISTSPALGDKEEFPTFFRVIADDNAQGTVILQLIQKQGWSRFGIIAGTSDYSREIVNVIMANAPDYGLEVSSPITVDPRETTGLQTKLEGYKAIGIRVIVLVPNDEVETLGTLRILNDNGFVGPEFAYIGSDVTNLVFSASNYQASRDNKLLQGMFVVSALEYSASTKSLEAKMKDKYNLVIGANGGSDGAAFYYDCVYAFAHALKNIMTKNSLTVTQMANREWMNLPITIADFVNISFQGATGYLAWQSDGNVVSSQFAVYNIIDNSLKLIGNGTSAAIDFYTQPVFFSGTTAIPLDSPVLDDQLIGYTKPFSLLITILTTVALAVIFASLCLLVVKSTHPLLRPISPPFMMISACGLMLCLASIYIDAKLIPSRASCNSGYSLLVLGFACVIGSVMMKLYRLYRRALSTNTLLQGTGALIAIELIIVLISVLAFPLLPIEHKDMVSVQHYFTCEADKVVAGTAITGVLYAYNGSLLVACCYLAFQTRDIYSTYNEAKSIGVAIYNIFACAFIGIIIQFMASVSPVITFGIKSILIIFAVLLTYYLMIGKYVLAVVQKQSAENYGLAAESSTGSTSGPGGKSSVNVSTTALKSQRENSKAPEKTTIQSAVYPICGSSDVTSGQWRNFQLHLVGKPMYSLALLNVRDNAKSLLIPITGAIVNIANDRLVISVKWPKGAIRIQTDTETAAAMWAGAIQRLQTESTGGTPTTTPPSATASRTTGRSQAVRQLV